MLRKISRRRDLQHSSWPPSPRCYATVISAGNLSDLAAALQSFTTTGNLHGGAAIHAQIIVLHDLATRSFSLWNQLLKFYLSCNQPRAARMVFDRMPDRDTVSYNTLISSHIRRTRDPAGAVLLYSRMLEEGLMPDALTLSSLLSGYNPTRNPSLLRQFHSHSIKFGLNSDEFVGGALVNVYQKLTGIEFAVSAFEDITNRDLVSWNIMIDACASSGRNEKTIAIFSRMRLEIGGELDSFAITSVLKTCSEKKDLDLGIQLHSCAMKFGLDSDRPVGNALLTMYSRCAEGIESAMHLFERIEEPNIITWTAMIGALVQNEMAEAVIIPFYREMLVAGVVENEFFFASILPAFGGSSSIDRGRMVHSRVSKSAVQSDIGVCNALMDMYFKCGNLEDARLVFSTMAAVDVVSWTIMIHGHGHNGRGREAVELFGMMKRGGFRPDGVTFLGALSSCSHGGLVDEGMAIFESMIGEYRMKPGKEHCGCVVDLLGRSGRLKGAERFIEEMKMESDPMAWETLLGACEIYGEMEMGKKAAERLMALKPGNEGAYVSLSNIYAERKLWEEKGMLRGRLDSRGMRKKEAAQSWV